MLGDDWDDPPSNQPSIAKKTLAALRCLAHLGGRDSQVASAGGTTVASGSVVAPEADKVRNGGT